MTIKADEKRLKRERLMQLFGDHCERCGSTERLTLDHIIPIIRGGSSRLENLRLLCLDCNQRKGAKLLPWHKSAGRADVAVMRDKSGRSAAAVVLGRAA